MKTFGLYKKQKLCSTRDIDTLFGREGAEFSRLVYPLRVIARNNAGRSSDAAVAFLISVPKKRLRHAVDRVLMRRRIREAFRLNHSSFDFGADNRLDVAFIYVADKLTSYSKVESAVKRILNSLSLHYAPVEQSDEEAVDNQ